MTPKWFEHFCIFVPLIDMNPKLQPRILYGELQATLRQSHRMIRKWPSRGQFLLWGECGGCEVCIWQWQLEWLYIFQASKPCRCPKVASWRGNLWLEVFFSHPSRFLVLSGSYLGLRGCSQLLYLSLAGFMLFAYVDDHPSHRAGLFVQGHQVPVSPACFRWTFIPVLLPVSSGLLRPLLRPLLG